MSRPRGSIIGAKPTWTTTATSGIWTLRQAEEMQAANQWPRGPEAPTSLAGSPGDEQVALTWTAPATTHGTITDYLVEYTPAAGSPTVVATGSTAASYTLTGLTNGTEYTFRVAAVNHTRGDFSSSVAVTPTDAPTDPDFASVTLLLHMNGSNGSTAFGDSSGSPKTITAYGNAQISTAQSKFGGAAGLFDGSGDYLGVSSHPTIGTQEFTIEFWLYPLTVSGLQIYTDFRPGTNGPYPLLYSLNSTLYYYVNSLNVITGSIVSSQWQHVAVSRSGSSTRLFVDGTQAGDTYTDTENYATADPTIGKSFDDYYFNAYMDELRITVGSGAGRYTAAFTPPTEAFPDA